MVPTVEGAAASTAYQTNIGLNQGDMERRFSAELGRSDDREPRRRSDSRLSADAKEFYPKNYTTMQNSDLEGVPPTPTSQSFLESTLQELTLNPGLYNSHVGPLSDLLMHNPNDQELHQKIIETVMEKAIFSANFRYTGVRLLCHFRSMLPHNSQLGFRHLVLRRCQEQSAEVTTNIAMGQRSAQSRGFALFLAELFMQMELNVGDTPRIVILGTALFEIIKQLLTKYDQEMLKCVCQVLKLAGKALDEQSIQTMDTVFEAFAALQKSTPSEHILALIKLRQNAWRPPGPMAPTAPLSPSEPMVERSFYLPSGALLSPEEDQFLQDNAGVSEGFAPDLEYEDAAYGPISNQAYLETDEESDEEFQAAFEEFLVFSNQKTV